MFPFSNAAAASATDRPRQLMRRAILFGVALLLLWLAVQLVPTPQPPDASVYSDASGTVAARAVEPPAPARERRLFQPGNLIALFLLGGGGVFALHLRRRKQETSTAAVPIEVLGQMQIAPNQQLRLVSCGGEVLLLGVTSGQITLLKSYPAEHFSSTEQPPPAQEASNVPDRPSALPPRFSDLLRQHVGLSATLRSN